MSILLKDFNGTDLIPFPLENADAEMIIGVVNAALLFFGILLETLVIAAILRVRQKPVDTLFVLSLCCADLIFNLYMFYSVFIVWIADGWSTGQVGCKVSMVMAMSSLGISIISVGYITLNRYLAIIWKRNITRFEALVIISLSWIFVLLLIGSFALLLSDDTIALQPSHWYCYIEFAADNSSVILCAIIQFVFMTIPQIFLVYAYSKIISFYREMNRKKKKVTSEVFCKYNKHLIK